MVKRRFVIGDVHGCVKTLVSIISNKIKPEKSDLIIFVGDLIDRGPNPKAVVDFVLDLQKHCNVVTIRGNHEQMLLNSLNDEEAFRLWFFNGCETTLLSFSVVHPSLIKKKYLDFFMNLPFYYLMDDFAVTHGDLNCKIDDPFSDNYTMLWGRGLDFKPEQINNRRLVVGHTPTPIERIQKSLFEPKIFVDGGCVYKNTLRVGLGNLVAIELNSMQIYVQENIE